MTESEAIKKAIRHFECMKNDAVVVLDSGFGTHQGESDLLYRNRKMYAELAINALENQIPKKPTFDFNSSDVLSRFHCACGKIIWVHHDIGTMDNNDTPNYCSNCGIKFNWDE